MAHKKAKITIDTDLGKLIEEGGWVPLTGEAFEKEAARLHQMAKKPAHIFNRHGGARPGSGRKPKGKNAPKRKVVTRSVSLLPSQWKAIDEARGKQSRGKWLAKIVEKTLAGR